MKSFVIISVTFAAIFTAFCSPKKYLNLVGFEPLLSQLLNLFNYKSLEHENTNVFRDFINANRRKLSLKLMHPSQQKA